MEFVSAVPQRKAVGRGVRQPGVISMYDAVENFQKMSLDQFAKLGWDRVRVLQKFDEISSKSEMSEVEKNSELSNAIKKHLKAEKPRLIKSRDFDETQLVLDAKMKDCLSHFVVRLAYCRSAELRNWLLSQEMALFKWRFQNTLLSSEQATFVRTCGDLGQDCQVVTRDEFQKYRDDLFTATRTTEETASNADYFYKIKFEHVTDLLRRRQVLMRGGWAFVHRDRIVGMLAGIFRTRLNKALVQLARKWPSFARVERDRLLPIVAQLTADRYVRVLLNCRAIWSCTVSVKVPLFLLLWVFSFVWGAGALIGDNWQTQSTTKQFFLRSQLSSNVLDTARSRPNNWAAIQCPSGPGRNPMRSISVALLLTACTRATPCFTLCICRTKYVNPNSQSRCMSCVSVNARSQISRSWSNCNH